MMQRVEPGLVADASAVASSATTARRAKLFVIVDMVISGHPGASCLIRGSAAKRCRSGPTSLGAPPSSPRLVDGAWREGERWAVGGARVGGGRRGEVGPRPDNPEAACLWWQWRVNLRFHKQSQVHTCAVIVPKQSRHLSRDPPARAGTPTAPPAPHRGQLRALDVFFG